MIVERFLSADLFRDLHGRGRIGTGANAATVRNDFPYDDDALNEVAVHPFLFAFAERLAGTDDLASSHGAIAASTRKRATTSKLSTRIIPSNTHLIPPKGNRWIDIPMIIYHSDVPIDPGPTYVVDQKLTESRHLVEDGYRFHERADFPELYKVGSVGSVPLRLYRAIFPKWMEGAKGWRDANRDDVIGRSR